MERVHWERLIMQPEVPQGNFNLEVLKVRSEPQWFLQGKLKEAWSDKKEFQFVRCIPSDKCFPCNFCFLGPCFYGSGQSCVSTLGELFLSLILNCFVVVEHFGFFKFKQLKLFRTKQQLILSEPLMKHKANSCPYRKISKYRRMLTSPAQCLCLWECFLIQ